MEIKVGEYVRSKDGYIRKIDNINTDKNTITRRGKYILDVPYKNSQSVAESKIVKHSPNITDIIEEGDYVNGYKISFIAKDYAKFVQCDYPVEAGTTNHYKFYKESIKDVVTKEQFNQMKYIVGDE